MGWLATGVVGLGMISGCCAFAAWRLRRPARQLHVLLRHTESHLRCQLSLSGSLRRLTIDSITVDRHLTEQLGLEPPAGFAVAVSRLRDPAAFKADLEDLLDGSPPEVDAKHWDLIAADHYDNTVRSVQELEARFVNWTGRIDVAQDNPQTLIMRCAGPGPDTNTAHGQIVFGHRHLARGMSVHGSSAVGFDDRSAGTTVSCPID